MTTRIRIEDLAPFDEGSESIETNEESSNEPGPGEKHTAPVSAPLKAPLLKLAVMQQLDENTQTANARKLVGLSWGQKPTRDQLSVAKRAFSNVFKGKKRLKLVGAALGLAISFALFAAWSVKYFGSVSAKAKSNPSRVESRTGDATTIKKSIARKALLGSPDFATPKPSKRKNVSKRKTKLAAPILKNAKRISRREALRLR